MSDKSIEQLIEEAAKEKALDILPEREKETNPKDSSSALLTFMDLEQRLAIEYHFKLGALWAKDNLGMVEREDVNKLLDALNVIKEMSCSTWGDPCYSCIAKKTIAEFKAKYPKEKNEKEN